METRTQPYSREAEDVVIASCLLGTDASIYDQVSQIIDSSDFCVYANQILFDCIGKLAMAGSEISEIELLEQVRKDGMEEDVGGLSTIYAIQDITETPISAVPAAKRVLAYSKLRKLLRASRLATEEAYASPGEYDGIAAKLEASIQAISDVKDSEGDGSISHATALLKEDFESMLAGTYVIESLPTGIDQIDLQLDAGGIGKGEVMVLSAPTSCGKTQFALNVVLRAAVTKGVAGLYFSFEMPAKQLAKRMTQTTSACNLKQLREGVMSADKQKRVFESLERLSKSPIFTEHYVRGINELRAKARTYKRKHDIQWLVVDYLQLVPIPSNAKKHDAIAQISHEIKLMAMELDIPVILLAQVNREGAKRESGLSLHDLKDSGDIENDADIILLMWPDGVDVDDARRFDADNTPYVSLKYNIAKNREGERDVKGKLKFLNQTGRFQGGGV